MNRTRLGLAVLLASITAGTGCADKPPVQQHVERRPTRAPELDQLDFLTGEWDVTMEVTPAGAKAPMVSHGTSTCAWDCDRRLIVEHFQGDFDKAGRMYGMGVYAYLPQEHQYSSWWYDSLGAVVHARSRYDANEGVWHSNGMGVDEMTGEKFVSDGTMKRVGDGIAWTMTEWDANKKNKRLEIKGMNRPRGASAQVWASPVTMPPASAMTAAAKPMPTMAPSMTTRGSSMTTMRPATPAASTGTPAAARAPLSSERMAPSGSPSPNSKMMSGGSPMSRGMAPATATPRAAMSAQPVRSAVGPVESMQRTK